MPRAGTAVRSVSEYRARPASLAPSMTDTASVCRYENPANNVSYQLQLIIPHTQLTKNLNYVNCEQRSVVCLHPDVRVGELESGAGETGGRPSPPPARPRSAGSAGQVITLPHCVYPSLYSKLCCTGTAAKVPPSCTFSSNTLLLLNTSNRKFCIVPFCDYSQNQEKCSYL